MMENKISSYTKSLALGHRDLVGLLDSVYKTIVVEEKIDGSQISFGKIGGELVIRSRGQHIRKDEPQKMFKLAVETITDISDDLEPDCVYRGEYLMREKHNTIKYDRVPRGSIIIFDIEDTHGTPTQSHALKRSMAYAIGLEVVPEFTPDTGDITIEWLKGLLGTESVLGGSLIEGIVVKNYGKTMSSGKYMTGKLVSNSFKERHGNDWKKRNPNNGDFILDLAKQLATDARFEKAVQHVREAGKLEWTPHDIGALIAEVHLDLINEEQEWIKEKLWKKYSAEIKRKVSQEVPAWYKAKLGIVVAGI